MKKRVVFLLLFALLSIDGFAQSTATIKGQIQLTGKLPGNPIIGMGMDPMSGS
jgi:hypothetical protein